VYDTTAEALANVVKHSGATAVLVEVRQEGGRLRWTVVDNGKGGADTRGGTGLVGLIDRVAALGGSVSVTSNPGTGTVLDSTLPIDVDPAAAADPRKPDFVQLIGDTARLDPPRRF